jgi:hypothetical protein
MEMETVIMGLIIVYCQIIYKLLVFDIAMMRRVVVSFLMEINILGNKETD